MVRNGAFSGHFLHNPYYFQNFSVTKISVCADCQNVQNVKPLKIDYGSNFFIQAYNSLYTGTGRSFHDEGLFIDRTEYADGYILYAFDLSPDLMDDQKFDQLRTGSVKLQLKFADYLPVPVTLIVYAKYQHMIEIDKNQNIIYDFSA